MQWQYSLLTPYFEQEQASIRRRNEFNFFSCYKRWCCENISTNRKWKMELGALLADTKEKLKGKLQPAEWKVDKQTLVEITRAQNEALLSIHQQLSRLEAKFDGVKEHLTKCIDDIDIKVEQLGAKVENLEGKTEVCSLYYRFQLFSCAHTSCFLSPVPREVNKPTRNDQYPSRSLQIRND